MKSKKMSQQDLSAFCKQIALILQAGISCYEGISIMKDDCHDKLSLSLFTHILNDLENGESFYQSLVNTNVFPDYMLEMIQIGERAGRLEDVMLSLSQHYNREYELNKQIKSALSYPLVMICMMFFVIIVLITQVLPIFQQVFIQLGTDLSGFAKGLMSIGHVLSSYYYIFMIIILVIVGFIYYLTKINRNKLQSLISRLFFTKRLSLNIATGHFTSGMAIALSSGLDIDESVDMAKKLVTNQELLKRIEHCQKLLEDQVDISTALINSKILSGMNARLIHIGFKTGAIDQVIHQIALRYDEETSQKISSMISIIEPTLVAVLSIIVGIILLSVMLPLIGIMSSIG